MAAYDKETRHFKQATHTGSYDIKDRLQQYLRDNFNKHNLESSYACEQAEAMLITTAVGYDKTIGKTRPMEEYKQLAKGAIVNFLDSDAANGEGQDKGHNLGRVNQNVAGALEGLHW